MSVEYHSRRTIRGQLNPKSTAVEEVSHSPLGLALTSLTDQSTMRAGFAVNRPALGHNRKATAATANGRSGCGYRPFGAMCTDGKVAPIADTQGNSFFHGAEAIGAWPARRIVVGGRL